MADRAGAPERDGLRIGHLGPNQTEVDAPFIPEVEHVCDPLPGPQAKPGERDGRALLRADNLQNRVASAVQAFSNVSDDVPRGCSDCDRLLAGV
jgi:hypothetical protein